jgi:hypothetical protein
LRGLLHRPQRHRCPCLGSCTLLGASGTQGVLPQRNAIDDPAGEHSHRAGAAGTPARRAIAPEKSGEILRTALQKLRTKRLDRANALSMRFPGRCTSLVKALLPDPGQASKRGL